jgi:hypothetical protein
MLFQNGDANIAVSLRGKIDDANNAVVRHPRRTANSPKSLPMVTQIRSSAYAVAKIASSPGSCAQLPTQLTS